MDFDGFLTIVHINIDFRFFRLADLQSLAVVFGYKPVFRKVYRRVQAFCLQHAYQKPYRIIQYDKYHAQKSNLF